MIADLLRFVGNLCLVLAARREAVASIDRRTDDEIRADPHPGDWWECGCGFRAPVLDDLHTHYAQCQASVACEECGLRMSVDCDMDLHLDLFCPGRYSCRWCHHRSRTHDDLVEHYKICAGLGGKVPCGFCDKPIQVDLYAEHEKLCDEIPF